jgi:signal transduction histidine kinase
METGLDRWEQRQERSLTAVPYVSLAVATVLAMLEPGRSAGGAVAVLALAGLAAGWMLIFVTLHRDWASRRGLMIVYLLGLFGLIAALLTTSGWFGIFTITGYIHSFFLRPMRLVFVGVALTAVLAATSWRGGLPEGLPNGSVGDLVGYLVAVAFNVLIAAAFTFSNWLMITQTQRRKAIIEQLAEANEKLEATLAENAGLHAQLLAQAREAGVLDERQRMAGEIHDTLAQGLTGIITQLQAADQRRDRPEEARRHLDAAARLARESLAEARRSVQALRPQPLEDARLPDALGDVVGRWSAVTGVTTEVTTTGTARPLHPEIEVALLRTAQEALANVAKHADARRVRLTLSYMEDLVTLDVRDDGVGFDPGLDPGQPRPDGDGGFGLTAMRRRLDRVAGALEIESEPGGGTAVSASVPAIPAGVGND